MKFRKIRLSLKNLSIITCQLAFNIFFDSNGNKVLLCIAYTGSIVHKLLKIILQYVMIHMWN